MSATCLSFTMAPSLQMPSSMAALYGQVAHKDRLMESSSRESHIHVWPKSDQTGEQCESVKRVSYTSQGNRSGPAVTTMKVLEQQVALCALHRSILGTDQPLMSNLSFHHIVMDLPKITTSDLL